MVDSNLETLVTAYDFSKKIGVTNRQYGNVVDTNVSDNSYSYSFNDYSKHRKCGYLLHSKY